MGRISTRGPTITSRPDVPGPRGSARQFLAAAGRHQQSPNSGSSVSPIAKPFLARCISRAVGVAQSVGPRSLRQAEPEPSWAAGGAGLPVLFLLLLTEPGIGETSYRPRLKGLSANANVLRWQLTYYDGFQSDQLRSARRPKNAWRAVFRGTNRKKAAQSLRYFGKRIAGCGNAGTESSSRSGVDTVCRSEVEQWQARRPRILDSSSIL